jgi:hypothetical protein
MLWPFLGGHWIELWFLNWLRPRLADRRAAQVAARLAVWLVGGAVLGVGMRLTAGALLELRFPRAATWWFPALAGLAFVGVELMAHVALQLRGRPSFVDGRG